MTKALRRSGSILLVTCLHFFAAATAGAEPVTVANDATPTGGVESVRFTERWRAGGADDEVFFGHVYEVLGDAAGETYVLDLQLVKIFVYSPEGELLREIGGEGEGPGEVNNVNSMVLIGDDRVGMGQVLPGRLAVIDREGLPVEKITITDPEAPGSGFVLLMEGRAGDHGLALVVMRWQMTDTGQLVQSMVLRNYGHDGTPANDYWQKEVAYDMANFVFDEGDYDFPRTRFDILVDGNVVFAPHRNDYEIHACRPDGETVWTATRPYESYRRSDEEKAEARLTNEAIGSHYPRPLEDVTVEDTEADIVDIRACPDGTFWVRTSRGDRDRPEGVLTTVDVFDASGKFIAQKQIVCPGDPARDGIHFLPGPRVVVVTGATDAYRREVGSTTAESMGGEETELEVICYGVE